MPFLEVKRHFDKPTEQYRCRLLHWSPGRLVLRYVTDREYVLPWTTIPEGAVTTAHYWAAGRYVLWRMEAADGDLLGHLFHICEPVTIRQHEVEYADLLLDVWRSRGGEVGLLDEEELAACVREGRLTQPQAGQARATAEDVLAHADEMILEAEAMPLLLVTSQSAEATMALGERLGRLAQPADFVGLWGELGAGKTCFIQGLAKGLGIAEHVTSPTFIIHALHPGRPPLHHIDAYRVPSGDELLDAIGDDVIGGDGVVAVEWIERVAETAPPTWVEVAIEFADGGRDVCISALGSRGGDLVEALRRGG